MEKPIVLSIILTIATSRFCEKRIFDMTVKYPFVRDSIEFEKHHTPHTLLVALGNNGISYEECDEVFYEIKSRLKELGTKIIDRYEIKYCCFITDKGNEVHAEFDLEYPMKD